MRLKNVDELNKALEETRALSRRQEADIKEHFRLTKESLRPKSLIRNSLAEVTGNLAEPGGIGSLALKAGGALAAGILAKKMIAPRATASVAMTVVDKMAKAGAATLIANNADKVVAYGKAIFNNLFGKKSKQKQLKNSIKEKMFESY